uniref:Glutathionylspermidine synthase pre-ATP-grasp-like domain-containing protein n=1 Tax=Paramoeba aestuarina TaxID=180227 RepID=A0A7S4NMH4_9EUKA
MIAPSGWSKEGKELIGCERLIAKPIHGREGENMKILEKGETIFARDGHYQDNKVIYQKALQPVTFHNGRFVVVGGWTVGDECAGISVREDQIPITTNYSFFLPHYVRG